MNKTNWIVDRVNINFLKLPPHSMEVSYIFICIFYIVYVFRLVDSTFDGHTLLFIAFSLGLVSAFILPPLVQSIGKKSWRNIDRPKKKIDARKRTSIVMVCVFLVLVANRYISINPEATFNSKVLAKRHSDRYNSLRYRRSIMGYQTVTIDDFGYGGRTIWVWYDTWERLRVGGNVVVKVHKGIFGYYVIKNLDALNDDT